jgi:hypothetical protein
MGQRDACSFGRRKPRRHSIRLPIDSSTTPGRALKSYIITLALIFSTFFITGTVAPAPFRQSGVEALQLIQGEYRVMEGEKLYLASFSET